MQIFQSIRDALQYLCDLRFIKDSGWSRFLESFVSDARWFWNNIYDIRARWYVYTFDNVFVVKWFDLFKHEIDRLFVCHFLLKVNCFANISLLVAFYCFKICRSHIAMALYTITHNPILTENVFDGSWSP